MKGDRPERVRAATKVFLLTAGCGGGGSYLAASKVHVTVDTLGHLLALVATPASEQERGQVEALTEQVQQATQEHVDQGYTGKKAAQTAAGW